MICTRCLVQLWCSDTSIPLVGRSRTGLSPREHFFHQWWQRTTHGGERDGGRQTSHPRHQKITARHNSALPESGTAGRRIECKRETTRRVYFARARPACLLLTYAILQFPVQNQYYKDEACTTYIWYCTTGSSELLGR